MTSTSRELTRTIKQARKLDYFTDTHELATFAFAWKWPQHVDWGMTDEDASKLYDQVSDMVEELYTEGKELTACQKRLLYTD